MPYTAEISRGNPTCFFFLIDQSRSMSEPFGEAEKSKAEFVSDVVNRTLHDLVIRSTRSEGVRDYYYVAVLAYGRTIGSTLRGSLSGQLLTPISAIADHPMRLESRVKLIANSNGELTRQEIRCPVWTEPTAAGWTHMCSGLQLVLTLLDNWLAERKAGFPPTVLHLTDGGSTDGDPTGIASEIRSRCTTDGSVLLLNCHVSSRQITKVEYPAAETVLNDGRARTLFQMSSILPEPFRNAASSIGINLAPNARGCVFNGDPVSVVQFFDLGTRPAINR